MKKLILLVALLASFVGYAADVTALRVTPTSGEPVTFLLDEKPEINFNGEKLTVTTTGKTDGVTFEMDQIDNIDFTTVTALEKIEQPGIAVRYEAGSVTFSNIPEKSPVSVFTVDGRAVVQTTASDSFTIGVCDLEKGIYVVRIGRFTTKISL